MATVNLNLNGTPTVEALLSALLVGKTLRVIGPGEHGDMRYDTQRATILVDAVSASWKLTHLPVEN
jgi:hypothetical protein